MKHTFLSIALLLAGVAMFARKTLQHFTFRNFFDIIFLCR